MFISVVDLITAHIHTIFLLKSTNFDKLAPARQIEDLKKTRNTPSEGPKELVVRYDNTCDTSEVTKCPEALCYCHLVVLCFCSLGIGNLYEHPSDGTSTGLSNFFPPFGKLSKSTLNFSATLK